MQMRQLATLFFLLLSFSLFGQKIDLGKVTKAELLEKVHKTDTSAAAAIIFKKAKTEFNFNDNDGFVPTTVFKIKLKVYKKEGLKWADFKIPYFVGDKDQEDEFVSIISGYTYNIENDKIVKTKVTGEGKFKEQLNEKWEAKSVTFPNVREGSIIELEYKFRSQYIETLPEFQYQYSIPVDYAEFVTDIPEFFVYKGIRRGYVDLHLSQKIEQTSQSFQTKVDLASVGRRLNYSQIVSTYKVSNVPALIEEDYVNNIRNYYGMLEQELQQIRYPDKEPKQISTTWEAISQSIYEQKDFNSAINRFDYFINDARSIVTGIDSEEERAKKLFNYVKNRMNWNNYYGYFPRRQMHIAYNEKTGSAAEINLMLVSMLRMSGLDANPVLMSTRENGFASFPSKSLLNYVIAAVKINDKIVLMDATDKTSDINLLPTRALNWSGRLIRVDGSSEDIDLMPKKNSSTVINIMADVKPNGETSGKIRQQHFDYYAFNFRKNYGGLAKESYIEQLEKKHQGLEVKDYSVQNVSDLELPIVENYDFTSTNSVEIIGDKMYLSPFIFFAVDKNPFKEETREYPIDFLFPKQYKLNVTLNIPDGYTVETLPQSKSIGMNAKLGNFKYNIANNGKQIQLLFTQEINQAVIEAGYYEDLKKFYKELVDKQTEKIVLKKA